MSKVLSDDGLDLIFSISCRALGRVSALGLP